ncbi:MAG: 50S ribosomal protein L24 [Clostridia bacterium]|nr:50S ribosomal protein L24 [Clostridia bacterium]
MSMTVKKGDTVLVICGKEKGKTGKVMEVFPDKHSVLVENLNVVTKHKKARNQQEKSAKIKKSAPIEVSNVQVVCGSCGKATRVAHKDIDGKNVRICKKCSASLDKEYVKVTKKEAKKTASAKTEKVVPATEVKAEKTTKTAPKAEKTVKNTQNSAENAEKSVKTTKTASKTTASKSSGTKTTTTQKSTKKTSKTEA